MIFAELNKKCLLRLAGFLFLISLLIELSAVGCRNEGYGAKLITTSGAAFSNPRRIDSVLHKSK